jgi:hypothetical protein
VLKPRNSGIRQSIVSTTDVQGEAVLSNPLWENRSGTYFVTGDFNMNNESPEARKAERLFRKEEKVRESAEGWTEYNGQKTRALQQLKRLREERLARGPIPPVVKPRAKRTTKKIAPPTRVASLAAYRSRE